MVRNVEMEQNTSPSARGPAGPRAVSRPGATGHGPVYILIEPNWRFIAPIMLALAVLVGIANRAVPTVPAVAMLAGAMLIAWSTPFLNKVEQRRISSLVEREALHAFAVGGPMLLFGLGIATWTARDPGLEWSEAIPAPILVSALATIFLNRRIPSITGAVVAMWLGVALIDGSTVSLLLLAGGACLGLFAASRQIRSDRAAAEAEQERLRNQQRAEELLSDFEDSGQGWFFETDRRGMLAYVSPTVGVILGCRVQDLIGKPMSVLFANDPGSQEGERTLAFHLNARSAFTELPLRAATDAEERWWSISGRPLYDEFRNFVGFRGSGHDLTEKRRSQQHASRLAHFDSLTGLANRLQMAQTLERILAAPNPQHRACAVFLLDLDRFKQVNDTLGHPAGDALLKQVAERLERTVGPVGRVGRLGGDEFEVILPGRQDREALATLADRIIKSLSLAYQLDGHRVVIGASVGIALAPDDGVISEELIRNADLALYAAKDGGRGIHHFYAADLHSEAEERRQLEADLRDAISNGGLELHYQPIVHTSTERVTGFEALLRWKHPRLGWLSPARFINVAEDAGLIVQIGEWALRTACHDLSNWPTSVRVAVNVSPLQFISPSLPGLITNILAQTQIDPKRLELEITESVFLNDDASVEAMFASLKRVGVRLALDDFGTGYASLGYLQRAPFDKIKIDQSFVRGATQQGSRNAAIIASIVSMAEALGMETTAEGVETMDELDLVRSLGCSHVQGYIYNKPLTREQATALLSEGPMAIADGPRASRAVRQAMLRNVQLVHAGQTYNAKIRNLSATGAMIKGLWNVPRGTIFQIYLAEDFAVTGTTRWCQDDKIGVEFVSALPVDNAGRVKMLAAATGPTLSEKRAVNE